MSYSQVNLVKNLNSTYNNGINSGSKLIAFNNKVVFSGAEGNASLNYELFESDGTSAGTVRIKDISPGNIASYPNSFYLWPNTGELYFSANGGVATSNFELWKSNGTDSGTIKISEFNTAGSSNPVQIIGYNNNLLMRANGTNIGVELAISNGTLAGSSILKDIYPGSISGVLNSGFPLDFIEFNGLVYFSARTDIVGTELWVTNGTAAGTVMVKDIQTNGSSDPKNFTIFNNKLYFTAKDGINGVEIWKTDGTAAGTVMANDVNVGGSAEPQNLTVVGGRLYFSAYSSTYGRELYYMNTAENVTFLRDIAAGSLDSNPKDLFEFNGNLYFTAGDGVNGKELWRTNGTILNTLLFKDINPSGSSNPSNFTVYNNKLYFTADNGSNGNEIWRTDGTSNGTEIVSNLNGNGSSDPESLLVVNDLLFFHARGGPTIGRELYTYHDPTLSIPENVFSTIKVFPNPTNSFFRIEANEIVDFVEVYDITGKKVKRCNNELNEYNVEDISPGLYFVKIQSENKENTLMLLKQ